MPPIRVVPARDESNIEQKLVTLLLAAAQVRDTGLLEQVPADAVRPERHTLAERCHGRPPDAVLTRTQALVPGVAAEKNVRAPESVSCTPISPPGPWG